jgi:hypothetical protein
LVIRAWQPRRAGGPARARPRGPRTQMAAPTKLTMLRSCSERSSEISRRRSSRLCTRRRCAAGLPRGPRSAGSWKILTATTCPPRTALNTCGRGRAGRPVSCRPARARRAALLARARRRGGAGRRGGRTLPLAPSPSFQSVPSSCCSTSTSLGSISQSFQGICISTVFACAPERDGLAGSGPCCGAGPARARRGRPQGRRRRREPAPRRGGGARLRGARGRGPHAAHDLRERHARHAAGRALRRRAALERAQAVRRLRVLPRAQRAQLARRARPARRRARRRPVQPAPWSCTNPGRPPRCGGPGAGGRAGGRRAPWSGSSRR